MRAGSPRDTRFAVALFSPRPTRHVAMRDDALVTHRLPTTSNLTDEKGHLPSREARPAATVTHSTQGAL